MVVSQVLVVDACDRLKHYVLLGLVELRVP